MALTPQPLDQLMTCFELSNADLVKASKGQLTFKMVQKGRKGRPLTRNVQNKILRAIQIAKPGAAKKLADLFHE